MYKRCIDFVKCIIGIRVLTGISLWDGTDRTLVGLAAPSLSPSIETGVEGVDLTPLFVQPASSGPHSASYSQMARCPCGRTWPCTMHGIESACNSVPRNVTPFMGYTVRVEDYRYTAWIQFNGTRNRGEWTVAAADSSRSEELYDHTGDDGTNWADGFENVNLAADPAHRGMVAELFAMVRARFDTPGSTPWPPVGGELEFTGDDE